MKKIIFYVPVDSAEAVKEAMFSVGAGRIGNYDKCAFQSEGVGQFRALKGANPHIGDVDELEFVKELKVEMICEDNIIENALSALREAHPYEEPAVDVYDLLNL